MSGQGPLKDKVILAVDDEQDILEIIGEELDMVLLHRAGDYDTAVQYLHSYSYDIVILDIMGVNGFELLKISVSLGFPTVMLTAHAITPEALKKSMKLGALSFIPKESITELRSFLEDIVINKGISTWKKLFDRLGGYFEKRFGPDWKRRDKFFQDFQNEMEKSEKGKD